MDRGNPRLQCEDFNDVLTCTDPEVCQSCTHAIIFVHLNVHTFSLQTLQHNYDRILFVGLQCTFACVPALHCYTCNALMLCISSAAYKNLHVCLLPQTVRAGDGTRNSMYYAFVSFL